MRKIDAMIELEIVLGDALVEHTVHAFRDAAHTDKIADGKIFLLPVEQAIRIRSGEECREAL